MIVVDSGVPLQHARVPGVAPVHRHAATRPPRPQRGPRDVLLHCL